MHEINNKYIVSLVDSSKKGSKNAFLQLCELNLGDIYSLCLMLTADSEMAHHSTKIVFIEAWKNIKQIRVDTSFNSWLHGFAIFHILEEIRKKEPVQTDSRVTNLGKARLTKIGKFLASLNTWERIAIILHDLENYSYNEINDLLWQFNDNEVKCLVRDARKKYLTGRNEMQ